MDSERDWSTIAPVSVDGDIFGHTFLGQLKEVLAPTTGNDQAVYTITEVWVYRKGCKNLTTPFLRIPVPLNTSSPGPFMGIHGVPLSNMFCFVAFDVGGGMSIICEGVSHAWFNPVGVGDGMGWEMIATGGLSMILSGICPFAPPPDVGWLGAPPPGGFGSPYPGFSKAAPLFASQPAETAAAGVIFGYGYFRVELQVCDLDDENLDESDGPASPYNTLTTNCCRNTDNVDDGIGNSDQGDGGGGGEPTDCNNGMTCKIVCKADAGGGGLGGPRPGWCYPRDGNRTTDYCETDMPPALGCKCSHTDAAGNPVPDPTTVPVGTVLFVKCAPGNFRGYSPCEQVGLG